MTPPCGDSPAKPAALVLSPEPPYPAVGGGPLRTASLVEYLARKFAVDVILFREAGSPDPRAAFPAGLARRLDLLTLPRHSRSPLARCCRNLLRLALRVPPLNDRFSGYERPLARMLAGRRYDLALIEHFWCAPYVAQLEKVCGRVVLDLHNIESELLHSAVRAAGRLAAPMFRLFAGASESLERRWLPRFALALAASRRDAERVERLAPGLRVEVYPNAIPSRALPEVEKDDTVVFSGNLEYFPNRTAVKFFARKVWPKLRARWPRLRWRILGKNPAAVQGLLDPDPRIELAGPVGDAVAELARSRLAVAPMLAGSGTRVKILEAWAAGLPVVSTRLGAEGLEAQDGEHLMLADTADAIVGAVNLLLGSREWREEMGASARRLYEQMYTWEAAWQRLEEAGL